MSGIGFGEARQAALIPESAALDSARFDPAHRRRLSAPALRTFASIADLWGLSEEQRRLVLGYPSRSTYHNWMRQAREQKDVTLDVDALMRLSGVLGIHQALGVLHAETAAQLAWLRGPHGAPLFGGQAPLALVTAGSLDGIMLVRRFLDAARGGLYMAPNGLDVTFPPTRAQDIVWR
ncbi:Protein of unknown function [Devosia crocina]|uniref:Uncharacterized protein n=1 Tax=Devosia crocina TaxID=429728 RepID=A0A1I7NRC4_9HYPH|nr:MbcA/ParS/Xre antitoxin family protein [Devosia crocina]SFV37128.1 Protein of unknown function [Devosia crocina]